VREITSNKVRNILGISTTDNLGKYFGVPTLN